MTGASVTEHELRGNSPLSLAAGGPAWEVQAGSAQVFAVLARIDGRTDRIPLFRLGQGEWAFPGPDAAGSFLLVALEDETRLAATALGGDTARSFSDGSLDVFRYAVESWLEKLTEAVADPSPPEGTPLDSPGSLELEPDAVVWPSRRFTWLWPADGPAAFNLFGDTPLDGESDKTVLPLPPLAWLQAWRATRIEVLAGSEMLTGPAWWPGVVAYERAALARLAAIASARREAETEVFERRSGADEEVRERLYGRLTAVVDPSAVAGFGTAEALGGVPAALALVAEASGVQLRPPPRSSAAEGLDQIDAIARASGIRWRRVALEGRWWHQDLGALLTQRAANEQLVALVSRRPGAYDLIDPAAGSQTRVDARVASTLDPEAVTLYRPLPTGTLSGRDILRFVVRSAGRDLWRFVAFAVAVGALSLVTPLATKAIFSSVVPQRETGMLLWLIALLVALGVGSFGFSFVTQLALARSSDSVASELQSAIWDRVLDLPVSFFRRYTPGALATKVMAIDRIRQLATTVVAASVIAVPVGLFNLALGFWLSPRLALFGSLVILLGVIVMVLLTRAQARHVAAMTDAAQSSFGVAMGLVDGVGKLRVAHAEERAFAQWGVPFASMKEAFIRGQRGFSAVTTFTAAGTAVGTLALFLGAATLSHGSLTGATFIAFNTAFTQALAATMGLSGVAMFFVQAKPLYQSAEPALKAEREVVEVKADPARLTGALEISHVTFRYTPDAPAVLDDVSFSLEPGQFLAIVGPSGAGKSSLIRILLGFESPELGSVRYEGKELENLDVRAVRRQIGVVTQSVRLLPGDIFRNIVGTRALTMDDAWEAAEIAGIADDIRAMPMQMHTFVAEGASTFSGGQRQRLLIARAVAAKPRLLFFDEATSALDNRTQSQVAEAIARLRATRVVIAHRLSTVRHADRILVLRDGRIVQEGTFHELLTQPGDFTDLAQRQLT